jgi:hypothetical protein
VRAETSIYYLIFRTAAVTGVSKIVFRIDFSLTELRAATGKRPNGVVYRRDTKNIILAQENTLWNRLRVGEKRSVAFSRGRRHWPHEAADQRIGFDASNAARRGWLGSAFSPHIFEAKPSLKV